MQYQVPQFIEVEDKIFGPLTFKQFLYLVGGGAIGFIIWSIIPVKFIAIVIIIPVVVFFIMLAFYNVNGRPLIHMIEKSMYYVFSPKLYIWKKVPKPIQEAKANSSVADQMALPKISDSKLKDLTWSLDIDSKLEKVESTQNKQNLNLRF